MKVRTVSRYKRISFLIEIIFGLVLLINGVILLINHFGYFPAQLSAFFSTDSIFNKTAYEWRSFIEFMHAMVNHHLWAFVLICTGIAIIIAGLHTKKSL